MQRERTSFRVVASLLVISLLASVLVLFAACNKTKPVTMSDIFKANVSAKEFSGVETVCTLPLGWEVYTRSTTSNRESDDANSAVGYIKELDAFVVKYTYDSDTKLSIMKCNSNKVFFKDGPKGLMFPVSSGITALRVKNGLIVCKMNNSVAAFDYEGRVVLSPLTKDGQSLSSVKIDDIVKVLCDGLIAIHPTYDPNGLSGYTSIYRPTTVGNEEDGRKNMICRVPNNDNKLSYVSGFDGQYVTVVGNKVGDAIYSIPKNPKAEKDKNLIAPQNAILVANGKSNYYDEITYLGGGKFFLYEDWTVKSTDEYDFYDGTNYCNKSANFYYPDNDRLQKYTANSDKVFCKISNNYYDEGKIGVDTRSYLNDGYSYVSYGLDIDGDKKADYDQYIVDKNMNIVMSLTENYGLQLKTPKKTEVSYYDLIKICTDGYFYEPIYPSKVMIYDKNGNVVGSNERSTVVRQELSNNIIIAAIVDPEGKSDSDIIYGAFNIYGQEIIPFEQKDKDGKRIVYTSISAYRGDYTIAKKQTDGNKISYVIIGPDGKEVEELYDNSLPLNDIAYDTSSNPIFKIGCYLYKEDSGEKDENGKSIFIFGIKNYNPNTDKNVVMSARMSAGCVMYTPLDSSEDVFVFEKRGSGDEVVYTIYKVI